MKTRTELHNKLLQILGSNRVYFQPPSKMEYPCILYDLNQIDSDRANDKRYINLHRYNITYISKTGTDESVINDILDLPYCSFDRRYIADNLYHDNFTIYLHDLKQIEED